MDRITDKIAALPQDGTYFSLEFFPPKTQQGFANLHARLSRMAHSLRPLFVNVTWGAGGSTSTKSLALAELTQRQLGLTTCLHMTCTNMSRQLIDDALEQAKSLGVRNILALRGDPPRSDEYRPNEQQEEDDSNNEFTWAVDLVRYIRKSYGDYFCIGVAAYPEGHSDQSCPEYQSANYDLPYLVEKVQAGADFIMTQLFYDVQEYQRYESMLRSHESGAFKTIPIVPGLMPIQSYQILRRTTKLSHACLPEQMLERLDTVKNDDEAVKRMGVDILSEMVESIRNTSSPGPKGFHFYTLNLEKAVAQIVERCKLISPISAEETVAVEEADGFVVVNGQDKDKARRRSSTANSVPQNRVIVDKSERSNSHGSATYEAPDDEAGVPGENPTTRANTLAISEGEGSLGREATWDDFPNGRWGDARSPAYGEIDGYGVSLHVSIPSALKLWGYPVEPKDITDIFERHVRGELEAIPFSEEGLNPETETIREELAGLIHKGWWTVASQPAVNGVRSEDDIFGWGPRNGFVFQKPFVELFCSNEDWKRLRTKLDQDPEQVTYFACNAAGDFEATDEESLNPVTWGSFTGKEIITPTMIEAVSFRAWAEEAFGIWSEWQHIYAPRSASAKLLGSIRDGYWLVNIIHHDFTEQQGLWKLLLDA